MRSKNEIQELVQQNIAKIKISEFVAEGGWPDIDNVDVAVFSQTQKEGVEFINLDILYSVHKPGCCFIPGADQYMRLSKTLQIEKNQIKFIENE